LQSKQWGYIKRSDSKDRTRKIDTQEGVIVEALLDSRAMGLVMSLLGSKSSQIEKN